MSDSGPSGYFTTVTPSDSADLAKRAGRFPRSIRVGTGGDVVVTGIDGSKATIKNVADGETLPVWVARIDATGTTAADIIAYY